MFRHHVCSSSIVINKDLVINILSKQAVSLYVITFISNWVSSVYFLNINSCLSPSWGEPRYWATIKIREPLDNYLEYNVYPFPIPQQQGKSSKHPPCSAKIIHVSTQRIVLQYKKKHQIFYYKPKVIWNTKGARTLFKLSKKLQSRRQREGSTYYVTNILGQIVRKSYSPLFEVVLGDVYR